jgi:hypothetical protein
MAAVTITLANGEKVRTATRRRFILVRTWTGEDSFTEVFQRSDRVATLQTARRRAGASTARWFIADTVTKRSVEIGPGGRLLDWKEAP